MHVFDFVCIYIIYTGIALARNKLICGYIYLCQRRTPSTHTYILIIIPFEDCELTVTLTGLKVDIALCSAHMNYDQSNIMHLLSLILRLTFKFS